MKINKKTQEGIYGLLGMIIGTYIFISAVAFIMGTVNGMANGNACSKYPNSRIVEYVPFSAGCWLFEPRGK